MTLINVHKFKEIIFKSDKLADQVLTLWSLNKICVGTEQLQSTLIPL